MKRDAVFPEFREDRMKCDPVFPEFREDRMKRDPVFPEFREDRMNIFVVLPVKIRRLLDQARGLKRQYLAQPPPFQHGQTSLQEYQQDGIYRKDAAKGASASAFCRILTNFEVATVGQIFRYIDKKFGPLVAFCITTQNSPMCLFKQNLTEEKNAPPL